MFFNKIYGTVFLNVKSSTTNNSGYLNPLSFIEFKMLTYWLLTVTKTLVI